MAAVAQDLRAGLAADVLHDDVVAVAGLVEAEVEDLDDVGVHQAGGGERLAAEALDERGVVGEVLGEQLDGDLALEPAVEGQVDGRHAAEAEPVAELVAADDDLAAHGVVTPPVSSVVVGVVTGGVVGSRRRGRGRGHGGGRGGRRRRHGGDRLDRRDGRGGRLLALLGRLLLELVDALVEPGLQAHAGAARELGEVGLDLRQRPVGGGAVVAVDRRGDGVEVALEGVGVGGRDQRGVGAAAAGREAGGAEAEHEGQQVGEDLRGTRSHDH